MTEFNYEEAFSRNIGWLTESEQQTLRHKKIAIAGMGGVGGAHLLTLSRLGIGQFHIADFDQFELANFNRQAGASMSHLGKDKVETMALLAQDINPEQSVRIFNTGVNEENLDDFLQGVDLYIDGLDFFVLDIRQKIFARCYDLGIPAITAAPLGMGVALINFIPGKMSFEQYFCLQGHEPLEQQIRFLVGLSPAMLQRNYLVDESTVNFFNNKGPSTPMACELCAGATAVEALKLLLQRGKTVAAPWGMHFDAYRNKFKKTWRPWGNNNPLQRIACRIARKIILKSQ